MQLDVSQALYSVEAAVAGRLARQDLPPPRTLDLDEWPPDYARVLAWRRQQLAKFEDDSALLASARAWYAGADVAPGDASELARRVVAWINHWVDTFDPRLVGTSRSTKMPLVLFRRQEELVYFVIACMLADAPGLIEKPRDMGVTWVCAGISVWLWEFYPGSVVGWGSYAKDKVDKIGDPKSVFEKLRMLILGLPPQMRPAVVRGEHLTQYTCRNPNNGAVINGEVGDNIGRGGRARIYFVDESSHLAHPEAAEAALSGTTRCRIDLSTVTGPNTVFYHKRMSGREWEPGQVVARDTTNVFVLDRRDHPEKDDEWYAREVAKFAATPDVVAREIDRNYMGAQEGSIIHGDWIRAAVDAHKALGFDDSGGWWGGLDLADGGRDANALVRGRGAVVKYAAEIADRDPGAVARQVFSACRATSPIVLQYDAGGGFGGTVKSEFNRLTKDDGVDVSWVRVVPWLASAPVLDPAEPIIPGDRESPTNKNYFENFRAQAWWSVAQMFYRTYLAVRGEGDFPPDQLISLDSASISPVVMRKLTEELSQATRGQSTRLKMIVNKAPDGAKSPNLADALIMARFPARAPSRGRVGIFGPKILYG